MGVGRFLRRLLISLWSIARRNNSANILACVSYNPNVRAVDLGSGDGEWTLHVLSAVGTRSLAAVEVDRDSARTCHKKGIPTVVADLNRGLPFRSAYFDLVHSNQVIEHLHDVDTFLEEISRITKLGGEVIISTQNLAFFSNIAALVCGFQPFSQHVSNSVVLGNPLSPHFGESLKSTHGVHRTVFAYHAILQLMEAYGLRVEKVLGAGLFPFPGFLAKVDPIHSHFLVLKARRAKTGLIQNDAMIPE